MIQAKAMSQRVFRITPTNHIKTLMQVFGAFRGHDHDTGTKGMVMFSVHLQWRQAVLMWVVALLAWPVMASEPRAVLNIGYAEFPPLEYRNSEGQPAGDFVDLTRRVAAEAGYDVNFLYVPISRAYLYLKEGKIDLWPGLTNIPALEGAVLESRAHPIEVQLSAWYVEGTPPIERFEDFYGRRLILIAGYTYAGLSEYLNQHEAIQTTEAPGHKAALDMLVRQRGHYLLDYRSPIEQVLQAHPVENLRQSKVRIRNASWLFSLKRPQAHALREAFDSAFQRLVDRGEVPAVLAPLESGELPGFPSADEIPPPKRIYRSEDESRFK